MGLLQMLLLSAVFMLMTLVVFILYGLFAHGIGSRITQSPQLIRWLQRGFAACFAGLAIKLVLTEQ